MIWSFLSFQNTIGLEFFLIFEWQWTYNTALFSDVHHNGSLLEDIQHSIFQNDHNKPVNTKSQDHKHKKKITKFCLVMRTFKVYSLSSLQIFKVSMLYITTPWFIYFLT